MSLGDENADGNMCFEEFVKYVTDHQKKLWIVFKTIDQDGSGEKLFFPFFPKYYSIHYYYLLLIKQVLFAGLNISRALVHC